MFNPIFAAQLALFAAPFAFDADNDSATAVSPVSTSTLSIAELDANEKEAWDENSNFAVVLNFKPHKHFNSAAGLRPNHVLATFDVEDDARRALCAIVSCLNARFSN